MENIQENFIDEIRKMADPMGFEVVFIGGAGVRADAADEDENDDGDDGVGLSEAEKAQVEEDLKWLKEHGYDEERGTDSIKDDGTKPAGR